MTKIHPHGLWKDDLLRTSGDHLANLGTWVHDHLVFDQNHRYVLHSVNDLMTDYTFDQAVAKWGPLWIDFPGPFLAIVGFD